MNTYRVLIADDEPAIRRILERICQSLNWQADSAEDGNQALALMEQNEYQIFTVDVNMPGPSGVELSRKILERYDSPAVLILTGYAEVKQAVEATKEGVYNYIQKDDVEIEDIKEQLIQAGNYHEKLLRGNQARKQRESEIQNAETASKQFQAIFDLSSDMVLIADAKTTQITDCNPAACEQLGYTRNELQQMKLTDFVPALTTDHLQKLFASSEAGHAQESTVQTKNGATIPIDISYTHVCLSHGEYVSVMMRNISERKEMQAQILHERNLLHLLMDNIPDSIFFKDADLKYTCINQAYASKLNLSSPIHALNKTDQDLLPATDAQHILQEEQRLLETQQPLINQVKEYLFPDGSKKWYTITKVPISDSHQNAQGLVGITRDISSVKNAEQRIRKTTQELEIKVVELDSIINGLPLGIILTNESFTVTQVNQWIETWLDVPKEFMLESSVNKVFHEYLQFNLEEYIQSLKHMEEPEWLNINLDFQEIQHEVSMKPLLSDETFLGVIVFIKPSSEEPLQDQNSVTIDASGMMLPETLENIKTPLDGILEMAYQLSDTQLNSEQKMLADTILQCGKSIRVILDSN